MKYRAEIDGLRALAVLPVVFFHADFKSFSGGFVGVDVFFVISGYLISSIILKELSEKQFCLVHFYERRARRILPALFLVVLVSLLFAWQWLPPRDLKDFGQSMVAVSTFLSNVLFWWESDYFATTSELKPLLHTWSLAVEEQFYILYPLALMFLWRFGLKTIVKLLIIIFFLSICTSYWGTLREPSFTFYMLPTRAWELIVGAFVAIFLWQKGFIISNITNQLLSLTGLFLIFYSVVMFDKNTSFPGLHALIPTLGTVLVILSSVKGTFTHALLSFKPLVGVGLISYSTYLWHQPILALARHRAFGTLSFLELIVLCVLSIVLGYLSWKFVEKPFRIKNKIGNKSLFVFSFFGLFLFSLIGFYIHSTNGVMYKFPEKVIELEKVKYHSINSTKNCKVKLIHGTIDEILKSCQIGNT
ncbi:MAG: acyltransferase, partial [Ignavibacteriae bacterium]|nr:acyltransferase [Ignavibacteriota bacterium]